MPKDKRTHEELAAQFTQLVEQSGLSGDQLSDNPAWQKRLQEITAFLPEDLTRNLIDRMQMAVEGGISNVAAFSRIHGLTKAEVKLLTSLSAGLTAADHAKKMGISVNTGRVHMQRILDKTAAKGQLDLIKMLNKH